MHRDLELYIKDLLHRLGIGLDTNPEQFKIFSECGNFNYEHIGAELLQMLIAKERMMRAIEAEVESGKIKGPINEFKYKWNKSHNFFEIIHEHPKIYGVVTFSQSSNDPSVTDFTGRVDSILEMTANKFEKREDKDAFIDENTDKANNTKREVEELFKSITYKTSIEEKKTIYENIKYKLQDFVIGMAIELVKQDHHTKTLANIVNVQTKIKNKMKQLWDAEVEQSSNAQRPAIFWANRGNDFNVDDEESHYVLRTLIPISNFSSNRRNLKHLLPANYWDSKDIALYLKKKNQYKISKEESIESSRSSALVGDEKDQILTLTADIRRRARNKLISILLDNPEMPLPSTINVDFLYCTLLSPTVTAAPQLGRSLGKAFGEPLRKFLDEGNEDKILAETKSLLKRLNSNGPLAFSSEDMHAINAAVGNRNITDLNGVKIIHSSINVNFPMNSIGDFSHKARKNIRIDNLKALDQISEKIKHKIAVENYNEHVAGNPLFQQAIADFETILKATKKNWKKVNYNEALNLASYLVKDYGVDEHDDLRLARQQLIEIFRHYIFIKDVLLGFKPLGDNVASYTGAAASANILWNHLGGTVHNSCKSAKDRTELEYVAIDSILFAGKLKAEYVYNGLAYGPGSYLVAHNVNGCEFLGLQINANVLKSIDHDKRIETLLRSKLSRMLGQFGENIFSGKKDRIRTAINKENSYDRNKAKLYSNRLSVKKNETHKNQLLTNFHVNNSKKYKINNKKTVVRIRAAFDSLKNRTASAKNIRDSANSINVVQAAKNIFKSRNEVAEKSFYLARTNAKSEAKIKYKENSEIDEQHDKVIVTFANDPEHGNSASYDIDNTYAATIAILETINEMQRKNGGQRYRITEPTLSDHNTAKAFLYAVCDFALAKEGKKLTDSSIDLKKLLIKHDVEIVNPSIEFKKTINSYLDSVISSDSAKNMENEQIIKKAFKEYLRDASTNSPKINQGICAGFSSSLRLQ